MKKTTILAALVITLMSCNGNKKTEASDAQTEQNSTEQVTEKTGAESAASCCLSTVAGVYSGTLPSASSPGIKTELTLNEDQTFTHFSEFLEEEDGKFTEKGTFQVENDILTATAESGTVTYFKIEENQLRMLNQDKEEITGEMADLYILKKTE